MAPPTRRRRPATYFLLALLAHRATTFAPRPRLAATPRHRHTPLASSSKPLPDSNIPGLTRDKDDLPGDSEEDAAAVEVLESTTEAPVAEAPAEAPAEAERDRVAAEAAERRAAKEKEYAEAEAARVAAEKRREEDEALAAKVAAEEKAAADEVAARAAKPQIDSILSDRDTSKQQKILAINRLKDLPATVKQKAMQAAQTGKDFTI